MPEENLTRTDAVTVRRTDDAELRQVTVVEAPIETASVKRRTAGPIEEPAIPKET